MRRHRYDGMILLCSSYQLQPHGICSVIFFVSIISRYDTIAEGVGIDRLTRNFMLAKIDDAFKVTDQEMVEMSRFLLREEGIFVGSSSGLNCVAAVRAARKLGPGHTIVTILCDSGQRHLTKFWNDDHIRENWQLEPKATHLEFLDGSTGQP